MTTMDDVPDAVRAYLETTPDAFVKLMPPSIREMFESRDNGDPLEMIAAVQATTDVLDVFCAVSELMAARGDRTNIVRSMGALTSQYDNSVILPWLIMRAGEWIRMLAEGTGQTVDEVVRGRLATKHENDKTDMEMFDKIVTLAETGEAPSWSE